MHHMPMHTPPLHLEPTPVYTPETQWFMPLNMVLMLAIVFLVVFALMTLDTPPPLDPEEILVPQPFEEYNGVRRNYGESTTNTGDLVTNYPSENLLCLTTNIGCTSSASVGGAGIGDALLNPITLISGVSSGTAPVLVPSLPSAPPTTNAPRLEFSEAVSRRGTDGQICSGLTREEAARFLCDRNVANRFFDDGIAKYCLRDVSREFCDTWNKCVRNINLQHFSKSYSESTWYDTLTGRILANDSDGNPIIQDLSETLPDGRRVWICDAFPPSV